MARYGVFKRVELTQGDRAVFCGKVLDYSGAGLGIQLEQCAIKLDEQVDEAVVKVECIGSDAVMYGTG